MPEALTDIAGRLLQLAMRTVPQLNGKVGVGPVLTVVRDTTTGKIYVGFNTGTPKDVSEVLRKSITANQNAIARGEIHVVRTDHLSRDGGHSEVNALNPAIRDREKRLGRKLTEKDLAAFELHNVWLNESRAGSTAARCEHCQRITRGVTVTHSLFVAEAGVVAPAGKGGSVTPAGSTKPNHANNGTVVAGQTSVPQRGSVTPAGSTTPRPVTTTNGSTGGGRSPGSAGMVTGLLVGPAILAGMALRQHLFQWVANRNREAWTAKQNEMILDAVEAHLYWLNFYEIMPRMGDIQKEKAAGREVKVRVELYTEWVPTAVGNAMIAAKVFWSDLLFAGDTEFPVPLLQPEHGFLKELFNAPRVSRQRHSFYFAL